MLFLTPISEDADSFVNDKVAHAIIFFVLSWLIDLAYRDYKFLYTLAFVLFGYGVLIEVLQGVSGYRTFSILDLIADVIGIVGFVFLKRTNLFKIF